MSTCSAPSDCHLVLFASGICMLVVLDCVLGRVFAFLLAARLYVCPALVHSFVRVVCLSIGKVL